MSVLESLGQYLTFMVGDEIFALNIACVREVLELTTITRVPRTPKHMSGVINLRGNAVPVVDMRLKLGLDAKPMTVDTCIIIVELEEGGETVVLGALVDAVREVFEIAPEHIEQPPNMGISLESSFIQGMGRQGERFVIILDIDRIFSSEELAMARDASVEEPGDQELEIG